MTSIKLTTDNRKAAAQRLAEIIGGTSRYTRVPRCAYEVGPYFIEKDGTITVPDDADLDPLRIMVKEGLVEPFEEEKQVAPEPEPQTADSLTVSLPKEDITDDALDRLRKLVDSKAGLIRKALGATQLTIQTTDDKITFPWWDRLPDPEEIQAYTAFLAALVRMAKEAKRIIATEREVDSEKYAFRGFLLRLGFIGTESKPMRKILMKHLSGSAAFPNQEKADAFSAAQKAKRDAAKEAEA